MWEGHRLRVQDAGLLEQIALNYLLFVPLGCPLPFAWPERYACDGAARGVAEGRVAGAGVAVEITPEFPYGRDVNPFSDGESTQFELVD